MKLDLIQINDLIMYFEIAGESRLKIHENFLNRAMGQFVDRPRVSRYFERRRPIQRKDYMEHDEISERQTQITHRLEDLIQQAPEDTAISLITVALSIYAKIYPPTLGAKERSLIRENYPDATDKLIADRSMSETGVFMAVATASEMARIAIDYSPLSHVKVDMDRDMALGDQVVGAVAKHMGQAFTNSVGEGLSPFGAAATMILQAVMTGKGHGVSGFKLIRPLLDALTIALDGYPMRSEAEVESAALDVISEQMGISRHEAKRYLAMAKRVKASGQ